MEAIRDIIKLERPDIMLIQETKMSVVEVLVLSHCFWSISHGKTISSNGSSGGITNFFQVSMLSKMLRKIKTGSS